MSDWQTDAVCPAALKHPVTVPTAAAISDTWRLGTSRGVICVNSDNCDFQDRVVRCEFVSVCWNQQPTDVCH